MLQILFQIRERGAFFGKNIPFLQGIFPQLEELDSIPSQVTDQLPSTVFGYGSKSMLVVPWIGK